MKGKYTLKRDEFDHRDHLFARLFAPFALPQKVDLREGCSPIVNQGELGSCTANAIGSGLREFIEIKLGSQFTQLSRLFLYYKEREAEGTIGEDAGAQIRTGMKIISSIGCAPEIDMPYDVSKFTEAPNDKANQDAIQFKVNSYQRLISLNDVKRCLYEGYPVVAGIEVFESFESNEVAKNGIVPMPESHEQNLGGHAICIVGYEVTGKGNYDGHFIVRNSWGTDWGDKGYFYLPFAFLQQGLIFDFWTAR